MNGACVLFDLDGTLTDADHLHHAAFNQVLGRFGRSVDSQYYKSQIMGHSNAIIFERLFPGETAAHMLLADEKEVNFRTLAKTLTPAAGLRQFLAFLRARGVPQGLVTNAPRANVVHQLAALSLSGWFDTLVLGEELSDAKPHPLPYRTGLANLGAAAQKSLAFEDSVSGLRSALAAGMAVVGLTTGLAPEALLAEGAVLAIADYADPRLLPLVEARLGL